MKFLSTITINSRKAIIDDEIIILYETTIKIETAIFRWIRQKIVNALEGLFLPKAYGI